jgi:pilus assembly protein CpaB
MNKKVLIVAGVALAAAIATTVFFGVVMSDRLTPPPEPAEVVVAAAVRDLPRGTRLSPGDIELTRVPAASAPAGAFSSVEAVEGRFLLQALPAGAPFTASAFPSSESGGLAATIPLGMRAVSLHVEEYAGVTEIVEAGDRVDIYMASDRRSPGRRDISVKTVLENIEVIDTGRWEKQPGRQEPQPVVTVIVDYEDARDLSLADQAGAIRLALRNPTDGNVSLQAVSPAQQAQAATTDANGSAR